MSDESDYVDEEQFDKIVVDLRKWLKKRCCPECAVSVLGAVAGQMIWEYTITNKVAKNEAREFCERITLHVQRLSELAPDQSEVTLQ